MAATAHRDEIPPGMLEVLIMKTLDREGRRHGFEIALSIQLVSEDVLQVEEGSLYPALQRLLIKGWLTGEWDRTKENRRARYYTLTREGRKQLQRELERHARISFAIGKILQQV